MNKINALRLSLLAAYSLTVSLTSVAQDIHFTQFEASPLIINPAFTGAFNGKARAAAIYRNQWKSVTIPFVTYGLSVDGVLLHDLSVDDYLAGGLQFYKDQAGDGNLATTSTLASLAYHKFLGAKTNKVLSVGLQGGYTQKSFDVSKLHFGDEFYGGTWNAGTSAEYPNLNNKVHYFNVNAGVSFSGGSENFGYTLGVGGNNITQPSESFSKKATSAVGLGRRLTGQAGAVWYWSEKFSFRPGVLFQTQSTSTEIIGGAEFNYIVGNPEFRNTATNVFIGTWYRSSDAAMLTAGFGMKGWRLGLAYDYNTSSLKTASNGNGSFEIAVRYIIPDPIEFARRLVYPCTRF